MSPADAPRAPYYAVIFTSRRTGADGEGYESTAAKMLELAARQPGFLGVESARGPDGLGITVSYWESLDAVHAWGRHAEHLVAQAGGRERWYETYRLRIARVESDRVFAGSRR